MPVSLLVIPSSLHTRRNSPSRRATVPRYPLLPRYPRLGGPKIALRGGGWHGRPAKEGGGVQKWASVPGPLFCVRTVVATKGAGTQILARKNFSLKNFPPHMCSQNDQRDVGIILSHVCWGRTPPPRHGRKGSPSPNPPPGTATKEGEGGVGQMGFRAIPPPPPAKQFSSRLAK